MQIFLSAGKTLNRIGGGVVTGLPGQCKFGGRVPAGQLDYNHFVMAVGYEAPSANATTGAFIVKNSWGTAWGTSGESTRTLS
jgi:hypothetical protein